MRHWLFAILVLLGIAAPGNLIASRTILTGEIVTYYSESQGHLLDQTSTDHLHWDGTNVICGDGCFTKAANQTPRATKQTLEYDTCATLRNWWTVNAPTREEAQAQYDSLRKYIEHCYDESESWRSFMPIVGDVARSSKDTTRYWSLRSWLLSVLYLNTTEPKYFCGCLEAIAGTYQYDHIPNAYLAIINYLLGVPNCHHDTYQSEYNDGVETRHLMWLQGDQSTPEDTTLPTLDRLGLGFLLNNAVPNHQGTESGLALASFTGSPNPFTKQTDLTFSLNRMTYVTIAIYDELGRMYWGDGNVRPLDAGAHTIHIDGSSLPNGTLYARISTGFGEVKTVKLVKN